jgi:hypothetical protein
VVGEVRRLVEEDGAEGGGRGRAQEQVGDERVVCPVVVRAKGGVHLANVRNESLEVYAEHGALAEGAVRCRGGEDAAAAEGGEEVGVVREGEVGVVLRLAAPSVA